MRLFRAPGSLALFAVLWFVSLFASSGLSAGSWNAAGAAIPDGNTSGVDIDFEVSGLTRPVGRVQVTLTLDHPHQGDLVATLSSPRGEARLVLFGRVGYRPAAFGGISGVDANFGGSYTFDDDATLDLWQVTRALSSSQDVVPPGTYRSSTPAPIDGTVLADSGGCASHLSAVFSGLTPEQANGTWTLNLADMVATEAGAVSGATLSIDPLQVEPIYADGFEIEAADGGGAFSRHAPINPIVVRAPRLGSCRRAQFDFTGSGRTSYALTRDNGEADEMGNTLLWLVKSNGGGLPDQQFLFGDADSDVIMPEDYDGDGLTDAAVWSPEAGYRIRRSSRPQDIVVIDFGRANDDVSQAGDYDGDGVADVALVRFPFSSGMGRAVVAGTSSPLARSFPLLVGSAFDSFAAGGLDSTGDGIADLPVQTEDENAPGNGLFTVFEGGGSGIFDSFSLGTATDVIVPGNRVGDARADTTVGGMSSGDRLWTVRDSQNGSVGPSIIFGRATDFLLGGDYDGDGLEDLTVFRPDSNPGDSKFLVRPSGGGADFEVRFGDNQDYPVANSRVH